MILCKTSENGDDGVRYKYQGEQGAARTFAPQKLETRFVSFNFVY